MGEDVTSQDQKLYDRETKRLEKNIAQAKDISEKQKLELILLLHYPPTNDKLEVSNYTNIINKYDIKTIVFGHLHNNFDKCLNGKIEDKNYFLTSSDYLNFQPILIKE